MMNREELETFIRLKHGTPGSDEFTKNMPFLVHTRVLGYLRDEIKVHGITITPIPVLQMRFMLDYYEIVGVDNE